MRKPSAKSKSHRRHPAEVTSDRLAETVERYREHFTAADFDMVAQIRYVLETIAESGA